MLGAFRKIIETTKKEKAKEHKCCRRTEDDFDRGDSNVTHSKVVIFVKY